jgi:hypothetical protein
VCVCVTQDELNYFCRDQALPNDLGVRLRGFFRNTIHMSRSKRYEATRLTQSTHSCCTHCTALFSRRRMHCMRCRYEALLKKMSMRLRGDAAYRMCEYRLKSVPFLVHPDLEPEVRTSPPGPHPDSTP